MKKKLVILLTATTMILATACGNNEDKKSPSTTSAISTEDNGSTPTENTGDNSTAEKPTQEPAAEIKPTLEKEAYVDFAGIKVPVTITWEEFKKLVADKNWKIISEENAPSSSNFHGSAEVETNCGIVQFNFMPDAYDTHSVLEGVNIDYDILTDKVNICGISCNSKLADLDKVLEAEISDSTDSKSYYIDEYLLVRMMNRDDDKFDMSISRLPWARRKVDIMEYLTHINASTELGEKIVVEAKENTNEKKELYKRITIALPESFIYRSTDLKTDTYSYKGYDDTTNLVNFGYNCNYVHAGRTCTEIEFTQELKKSIDLWNSMNMLPARISEVQIGKYKGYELFKESNSDTRSHVKTYLMWIDGYQVEFFVSYYNAVDPTIYEEAFNEAMQAIASVEKIQ